MAEATAGIVQTILDSLGWKHATTGTQSVGFSLGMQVLGVTFDLSCFWQSEVRVANRHSRVERILALLKNFEERQNIQPGEAATMHGLLNHAGGFVIGRSLKPAARYVFASTVGSNDLKMIARVARICQDIQHLLRSMQPRVIGHLNDNRPAIVYTDGVSENGVSIWGAVVITRPTHWRGALGSGSRCCNRILAA